MSRLPYGVLKLLAPFITHSNAAAAQPALYAATSPDADGGDYFGPVGIMELRWPVGRAKRDPYTRNTDAAGRLWHLSEELTGHSFDVPKAA